MRILLGIVLTILLNSCASIQTKIQYDPKENFSQYRTYQWIRQADENADPQANDQLFYRWVRTAVDNQLAAKGYIQQTSGSPDFLISYAVTFQADRGSDTSASPYLVSDEGWGWPWGWASSHSSRPSIGGTFFLDVLDGETKKVVWLGRAQAVVSSSDSDKKKEERANKAVSKLLARFPP